MYTNINGAKYILVLRLKMEVFKTYKMASFTFDEEFNTYDPIFKKHL